MNILKDYRSTDENKNLSHDLNYPNMFWLFMIANVVGVVLEGIWTLYKFGRWETHVVTIWGPFCLIYGAGAVMFYVGCVIVQKKHPVVQFILFGLIADVVEYICAWILEDGLYMKAWTYHKHFMNLQGRISLQMTIIWGIIGMVYFHCLVPKLGNFFKKLRGKFWSIGCILLTVFMIVNMSATVVCLERWSNRHKGIAAANPIEEFLDRSYDDARMKKIFCEWWFIDQGTEFWREYKKK